MTITSLPCAGGGISSEAIEGIARERKIWREALQKGHRLLAPLGATGLRGHASLPLGMRPTQGPAPVTHVWPLRGRDPSAWEPGALPGRGAARTASRVRAAQLTRMQENTEWKL